MSGDDQHYLSAALIGGFGIARAGKPLRKAQIVVRELASGEVHPATVEDIAHRRALYRLLAPGPGVDPDIVDKLWTPVEGDLPAMVARLDAGALEPDDPDKWIWYAAMAGVRHPTAFAALAVHHQQSRGEPEPMGDQLQVMRVEALLNGQAQMHGWRWRVLHSPTNGPRFVLSDRGWNIVREPGYEMHAVWLPVGPRVGILGYLDDPLLPPPRPPFSEHRELTLSWAEWFNATAFSDTTITHAVFAHPDDEQRLRDAVMADDLRVTEFGPYRGQHWRASTLFD
ncbi:MAG: DUF4238 domain-containing protein [Actinomycetota bacterium]|jgi:hypothetical protein|nr:DUF4238 domain-containing protein [Actinomycetota bacterium]